MHLVFCCVWIYAIIAGHTSYSLLVPPRYLLLASVDTNHRKVTAVLLSQQCGYYSMHSAALGLWAGWQETHQMENFLCLCHSFHCKQVRDCWDALGPFPARPCLTASSLLNSTLSDTTCRVGVFHERWANLTSTQISACIAVTSMTAASSLRPDRPAAQAVLSEVHIRTHMFPSLNSPATAVK